LSVFYGDWSIHLLRTFFYVPLALKATMYYPKVLRYDAENRSQISNREKIDQSHSELAELFKY